MAEQSRPWWQFWKAPAQRVRAVPVLGIRSRALRAPARGRVTADDDMGPLPNLLMLAPPDAFDDAWHVLHANRALLERLPPSRLLEVLADMSPEVSKALWDFLRLCNPGWEATAQRKTASGKAIPHARGQAATDAFLDKLDDYYGAVDIVFGRLFMGVFLRGALFSELVMAPDGRTAVDLVTPDPITVRFRRVEDPLRGPVWQPGQWQRGQFVPFDRPTVRYTPVDPFPSSPYGRPLAASALFVSLFLLGMLHDIRRVVQQQGYPRLDISLDTEKLASELEAFTEDEPAYRARLAAIVQEVIDAYAALEPDDAYVHTDVETINKPVGAVDASSLGGIDRLIQALERMATRALKSTPLMMGLDRTSSETNSNREWEIFAAGIKSIQHYAETMLERLLTLNLEAQGIQAKVMFRFAELRAAEALRDAQVETMQIANAAAKRDQGWLTQDQASEEVTGEPAVGPAPLAASGGSDILEDDGDGQERLDQGSDRALVVEIREARADVALALATITEGERFWQRNGHH
jgi:hypothetical protein